MGDMDYEEAATAFVWSTDLKRDEKVAGIIEWAKRNDRSVDAAVYAFGEIRKAARPQLIEQGFAP